MSRSVHFLFAAAALSIGYAVHAPAQSTSSSQIERGRQRFVAVGCWQCHGYEGQGGAGPRIGPNPMPLPAFLAFVRAPGGDMPPYREAVLSNADLTDIHAFLAARRPPTVLSGNANVVGQQR